MTWDVIAGIAASTAALIAAVIAKGGRDAIQRAATRGVDSWFDSAEYETKFRRELEAVRGTQRQELRFRAYGRLHGAMRPLARYGGAGLEPDSARRLAEDLSGWYFSEYGGMLLTAEAREFYFALQDVLDVVVEIPGWRAERGEPERDFEELLQCWAPSVADVASYLDAPSVEWPVGAIEHGKAWRVSMRSLCEAHWLDFTSTQQFALIQQVSSRLRTVLTKDLDSRSW